MNALVVLLARLSTGLFLILWAYAVHVNSHGAVDLVTNLSQGFFADESYRMALVYGAAAVGVLVILGFIRQLAYPLQALALAVVAASVWQSLADPLGLFLFTPAETNIFFFPLLGLFVASLVPLSLWKDDSIAIDRLFGAWRNRDKDSGDEQQSRMRQMPMVILPAAAAASHAHEPAPAHHELVDHGHDDQGHEVSEAHISDSHEPDAHGHGYGHATHH